MLCHQAQEKDTLEKLRTQLEAEQAGAEKQRAELKAAAQKVTTSLHLQMTTLPFI